MDIAKYERIWVRGLTPRMRNLLIWVAQHEDHEPWPQWANGNTAKALRQRGYITTYPYRLTDEGVALLSVNAGHTLMDTTPAPDALTAANARIAELEAALKPFANVGEAWRKNGGDYRAFAQTLTSRSDYERAADALKRE